MLQLLWKELPDLGKMMSMGRQQRYLQLLENCVSRKIPYLLAGHHKDDQIETVSPSCRSHSPPSRTLKDHAFVVVVIVVVVASPASRDAIED